MMAEEDSNDTSIEDDVDLYDDLDVTSFTEVMKNSEKKKTTDDDVTLDLFSEFIIFKETEKVADLQEKLVKVVNELQHYAKRCAGLEEDNSTLQKNMTSLWKTAVALIHKSDHKCEQANKKVDAIKFIHAMEHLAKDDVERLVDRIVAYSVEEFIEFAEAVRSERECICPRNQKVDIKTKALTDKLTLVLKAVRGNRVNVRTVKEAKELYDKMIRNRKTVTNAVNENITEIKQNVRLPYSRGQFHKTAYSRLAKVMKKDRVNRRRSSSSDKNTILNSNRDKYCRNSSNLLNAREHSTNHVTLSSKQQDQENKKSDISSNLHSKDLPNFNSISIETIQNLLKKQTNNCGALSNQEPELLKGRLNEFGKDDNGELHFAPSNLRRTQAVATDVEEEGVDNDKNEREQQEALLKTSIFAQRKKKKSLNMKSSATSKDVPVLQSQLHNPQENSNQPIKINKNGNVQNASSDNLNNVNSGKADAAAEPSLSSFSGNFVQSPSIPPPVTPEIIKKDEGCVDRSGNYKIPKMEKSKRVQSRRNLLTAVNTETNSPLNRNIDDKEPLDACRKRKRGNSMDDPDEHTLKELKNVNSKGRKLMEASTRKESQRTKKNGTQNFAENQRSNSKDNGKRSRSNSLDHRPKRSRTRTASKSSKSRSPSDDRKSRKSYHRDSKRSESRTSSKDSLRESRKLNRRRSNSVDRRTNSRESSGNHRDSKSDKRTKQSNHFDSKKSFGRGMSKNSCRNSPRGRGSPNCKGFTANRFNKRGRQWHGRQSEKHYRDCNYGRRSSSIESHKENNVRTRVRGKFKRDSTMNELRNYKGKSKQIICPQSKGLNRNVLKEDIKNAGPLKKEKGGIQDKPSGNKQSLTSQNDTVKENKCIHNERNVQPDEGEENINGKALPQLNVDHDKECPPKSEILTSQKETVPEIGLQMGSEEREEGELLSSEDEAIDVESCKINDKYDNEARNEGPKSFQAIISDTVHEARNEGPKSFRAIISDTVHEADKSPEKTTERQICDPYNGSIVNQTRDEDTIDCLIKKQNKISGRLSLITENSEMSLLQFINDKDKVNDYNSSESSCLSPKFFIHEVDDDSAKHAGNNTTEDLNKANLTFTESLRQCSSKIGKLNSTRVSGVTNYPLSVANTTPCRAMSLSTCSPITPVSPLDSVIQTTALTPVENNFKDRRKSSTPIVAFDMEKKLKSQKIHTELLLPIHKENLKVVPVCNSEETPIKLNSPLNSQSPKLRSVKKKKVPFITLSTTATDPLLLESENTAFSLSKESNVSFFSKRIDDIEEDYQDINSKDSLAFENSPAQNSFTNLGNDNEMKTSNDSSESINDNKSSSCSSNTSSSSSSSSTSSATCSNSSSSSNTSTSSSSSSTSPSSSSNGSTNTSAIGNTQTSSTCIDADNGTRKIDGDSHSVLNTNSPKYTNNIVNASDTEIIKSKSLSCESQSNVAASPEMSSVIDSDKVCAKPTLRVSTSPIKTSQEKVTVSVPVEITNIEKTYGNISRNSNITSESASPGITLKVRRKRRTKSCVLSSVLNNCVNITSGTSECQGKVSSAAGTCPDINKELSRTQLSEGLMSLDGSTARVHNREEKSIQDQSNLRDQDSKITDSLNSVYGERKEVLINKQTLTLASDGMRAINPEKESVNSKNNQVISVVSRGFSADKLSTNAEAIDSARSTKEKPSHKADLISPFEVKHKIRRTRRRNKPSFQSVLVSSVSVQNTINITSNQESNSVDDCRISKDDVVNSGSSISNDPSQNQKQAIKHTPIVCYSDPRKPIPLNDVETGDLIPTTSTFTKSNIGLICNEPLLIEQESKKLDDSKEENLPTKKLKKVKDFSEFSGISDANLLKKKFAAALSFLGKTN